MNQDPFLEYERELEEKGKKEIAAEDAAWNALPQAERDRLNAERAARIESMFDIPESDKDEEEEDEDDGDE